VLTVSARFLEAIRETHTISVAAYVYRPSDLATPIAVPVIGGSVTIDRDARTRRTATLDVTFALEDDETRDVIRELPFGGYCSIERGIQYADGTIERVALGRFRVEAISWAELQGQASLNLADRMAQIADEQFLAPWDPTGLKPSNAAHDAVYQVFGNTIAYHVLTNPTTEPTLIDTVYSQDRAAAVADLAAAVAAEAYFDHLGDFVIRPHDTVAGASVWTIDAGDRGSMIEATETLDRSSVRNGVLLRGQANAALPPTISLATYDVPTSPVRWGGPMGRIPQIEQTTSVQTQAQADGAARARLNQRVGLSRTLALTSIPNPAIEPGDVVEIVHPDGRSELQTVNAVRLGLGVDGRLELTTTAQLVELIPVLEPTFQRYVPASSEWQVVAP